MANESIDEIDVFCAVTNSDEANIMSSMLAKRLGARKVMTLINNSAYVDLVQGGLIDIAISPEQAYNMLKKTDMDFIVLGSYLVKK